MNTFERKEVLFADLGTQLEPQDAIRDRSTRDGWRRMSYETATICGTLVAAQSRSHVPSLTLKPRLTGWYRIYLGLGRYSTDASVQQRLFVSLTGDTAETVVAPWSGLSAWTVDEVLYRCADMTGKSITFRHPEYETVADDSVLASVRFVPMDEEEVKAYLAECARRDTRRLYATEDVHNFLISGPKDMSLALAQIENYRNSDVGTLALEYWGFAKFYTGTDVPEDEEIFGGRNYEACAAKTMRAFQRAGMDPYKEMIAHAKDVGLAIHLSMRMGAWNYEFPWDEGFATEDYDKHPELHMRDRDGVEVARLSFAYPETWQIIGDYYSKMAEYDIDGVDFLFNRGYPFILFEEPLLAVVREKYGVDARTLSNNDPRLIGERCRMMNEFIRYIRTRLDGERAARGQKPLRYTAHVHRNLEGCLFVGLDLPTWAKEKTVDAVVCYPLRTYEDYPDEFFADEGRQTVNVAAYEKGMPIGPDRFAHGWYDPCLGYSGIEYDSNVDKEEEIRELVSLFRDTGVSLYIHIMPRSMHPTVSLERARLLYAWGVDGIGLWDANARAPYLREWTMVSRLGHREEIDALDVGDGTLFRNHNYTKLGGLRMDRFPPHWGA